MIGNCYAKLSILMQSCGYDTDVKLLNHVQIKNIEICESNNLRRG